MCAYNFVSMRAYVATDGPGSTPGFLLWQAANRWQRTLGAALRPLGLTHVQFVLLASVWWLARTHDSLPTQRQIADQAGTDPMMTSQVLRALERRGLVSRARGSADARVRTVMCTPEGARLSQRAVRVVEAADADFFGGGAGACELRRLWELTDPARHDDG